jgi:hypothetical protein
MSCDGLRERTTLPGADMSAKPPEDFLHLLFLIKLYAAEIASTIIFVAWLARAVWHELRPPKLSLNSHRRHEKPPKVVSGDLS